METFVCKANFNALITEKTCRARVAFMGERAKQGSGYKFTLLGPNDSGENCLSCKRGIRIIKEMKKEKEKKS